MNARQQANMRVRKNITDALFALMREKDIADITITELIARAGVARASFYRNFSSKEDVVIRLIHYALNNFLDGASAEEIDFKSYGNILRAFEFFKMYGPYVLGMYRSNFATVLLDELNNFHAQIAGNMPANSVERYGLNMFMGALFNTAIAWLNGGAKESSHEIATFFMGQLCLN